ncbi:hypothetical protein Droror1_Dr00027325 [Drosera rotundifolia]
MDKQPITYHGKQSCNHTSISGDGDDVNTVTNDTRDNAIVNNGGRHESSKNMSKEKKAPRRGVGIAKLEEMRIRGKTMYSCSPIDLPSSGLFCPPWSSSLHRFKHHLKLATVKRPSPRSDEHAIYTDYAVVPVLRTIPSCQRSRTKEIPEIETPPGSRKLCSEDATDMESSSDDNGSDHSTTLDSKLVTLKLFPVNEDQFDQVVPIRDFVKVRCETEEDRGIDLDLKL